MPSDAPAILRLILYYGTTVNLGFFAFNILPVPPLDGSRVLYAVAPEGVQRVMDAIERTGLLLIFIIVLVASPVLGRLMGFIINGVLTGFNYILMPLMWQGADYITLLCYTNTRFASSLIS